MTKLKNNSISNPHSKKCVSISCLIKSVWNNRQLIGQMSKREILGRYKGSVIGISWSLFTPIFMLLVYTFVFSIVFKSRWGNEDNFALFAVVLFSGTTVLNLFSDALNRSPSLIINNVNFVKKVLFPLEILPVVAVINSMFHFMINLIVLFLAILIMNGYLYWTVVLLPFILAPLIIVTLGFVWALSALGVYLRDIGQVIGIFTTTLLFLSPIFYPTNAVPKQFLPIILANPLTFIIEQSREVIIWGRLPDWKGLLIYTLTACLIAWIGFAVFQKTRSGFSDVL